MKKYLCSVPPDELYGILNICHKEDIFPFLSKKLKHIVIGFAGDEETSPKLKMMDAIAFEALPGESEEKKSHHCSVIFYVETYTRKQLKELHLYHKGDDSNIVTIDV